MYCCRCGYRLGCEVASSSAACLGAVQGSWTASDVPEARPERNEDRADEVSASSCMSDVLVTEVGLMEREVGGVTRLELLESPAHVHGLSLAGLAGEGDRERERGEGDQAGPPKLPDPLDRRLDRGVGNPFVPHVPSEAVSAVLRPVVERVPPVLSGEMYDGGEPWRTLSAYEGGRSLHCVLCGGESMMLRNRA